MNFARCLAAFALLASVNGHYHGEREGHPGEQRDGPHGVRGHHGGPHGEMRGPHGGPHGEMLGPHGGPHGEMRGPHGEPHGEMRGRYNDETPEMMMGDMPPRPPFGEDMPPPPPEHEGPLEEMEGRDYEERPEMMMMSEMPPPPTHEQGSSEEMDTEEGPEMMPFDPDMMDPFEHGERGPPRDGMMMKKGMRGPGFFGGKGKEGDMMKGRHEMWKKEGKEMMKGPGFFGGGEGGERGPHHPHMWKKEEEEMNFVQMDCDVDTTPCKACHETEGFFVCRSLDKMRMKHHGMKFGGEEGVKEVSMCITAEKGLEGDMCGCCGGECPEACTLACEFEGKDGTMHGGVLVDFSYPSKEEEGLMEEKQICVPESRSVSMLASGKAAKCAMDAVELREAE